MSQGVTIKGVTTDGQNVAVLVNEQGELATFGQPSLVTEDYDSIAVSYPTTSSEVYEYSMGGNVVATVTITYTDPTKSNLTSVVRV